MAVLLTFAAYGLVLTDFSFSGVSYVAPGRECGATPSVKCCHVLLRAHFEAKTIPNLVPRVAKWFNVRAHFVHILGHLYDDSAMREFATPLRVKTHRYTIISTVYIDGCIIVLKQHF